MAAERGNKTKRQTDFLQRLADANERLKVSINGLNETTLCNEPVLDDWTIKDILGHIVSWNDEFRANIGVILQGEHPGYDHQISGKDNFSAWNEKWIAKKRNWSLYQIIGDIERDYQEAVELILGLKAEQYLKCGVTPWKDAVKNTIHLFVKKFSLIGF